MQSCREEEAAPTVFEGGRARQRSVLALSEEPDDNPMLPPPPPAPHGAPILGRVTVTLVRPINGGLGLGFNDSNHVSSLGESTPAADCGEIFIADHLIEINGIPVAPGGLGAMVRATAPGSSLDFTFMRETGEYEDLAAPLVGEPNEISLMSEEEGGFKGAPTAKLIKQEELATLLEPSGELNFDPNEREATDDELRRNALTLMTELLRQGFCNAAGKRALLEVLPTLMSEQRPQPPCHTNDLSIVY
jgi:hypothetical protein